MKYKKVLVTGSSGFIGSHVADALEENGYQVILFDTVPSKYKTKTQKEFIGDILKPDHIEKAICNSNISISDMMKEHFGFLSSAEASPAETQTGEERV